MTCGNICICIEESTHVRIVISCCEIVEPCFLVVGIAAVAEGVEVCYVGMIVDRHSISVAVGYIYRGAVSIVCIACYNITVGIDDSGYIALQILYKVIVCTVSVNTNYSAVAVKICNEIFGTVYGSSLAYVCAADDDILCISCACFGNSETVAVVAVSTRLEPLP